MGEVTLYLDGQIVDVDAETLITETKQINNLFDLKDRQSSFTNFFTILLTKETNQKLYYLNSIYNTSNIPYRKLTANLYRGGTSTILDGKFITKSLIGGNKLKGNIQDGNVSIFDAIGEGTLSELNFNGLSHEYNWETVLDSYVNEWQNGFIYTAANYGVYDTIVELKYQVPCLFMKWIFEQIFIESGFTYSYRGANNPLDSIEFKSKAITIDKGLIHEDAQVPTQVLELDVDETITTPSRLYIELNETTDPFNYHQVNASNQSQITPTENNYYELIIDGKVTPNLDLVLEINGTPYRTFNNAFSETIFVYLSVTDVVKFYVDGQDYKRYKFDLELIKESGNNYVNFNSYLTNFTKKDFLKAVFQMYGIIFQRERGTNNYEMITYKDMFTDRSSSVDLSNKLHKYQLQEFTLRNYGQKNNLSYNYNNSESDYFDGSFFIDNENLQDEVDVIKFPFKAPEVTEDELFSEYILSAPLYTVERNDDGTIKEVKSMDSLPYIMNIVKIQGTLSYDTGNFLASSDRIVAISNFTDLNLNDVILNNYTSFIKTINRSRVYTVEMELNSLDVISFDFLKLVYLSQFQKYFYCNKIMNFRENKVTKVELVEVNTTINL